MASTGNSAATATNRRTGARLILVMGAAALLVTLPVIPLRFLGIPGPDLPADFNKFTHDLMAKFGAHQVPVAKVPVAAPSVELVPADKIGTIEQAEQDLQSLMATRPDDASLHNRLGLVFAENGDYEKAAVELQKAIDLSRAEMKSLGDSEISYRTSGETSKAADVVLERSKVAVELSAAHSSLARVYDQLGQHDKVVAQLDQLNGDIAFGSVLTAKVMGTNAGIGAASAASHKLSPQVLSLLARAEALHQSKRTAEAIEQYKKIVQIDPDAAVAHQRLGEIAAQTNNSYLAVHELEAAAQLEPADAKIRNSLGVNYRNEGDNEKAIEQFEKALAIDSKCTDAAYNLGNLLCSMGRFNQAEQEFERLIKLTPNSAPAHHNLAMTRAMLNDNKGAIPEFEAALRINPDLAQSHYGLGLAFYNTNNFANAVREFRRALTLNPSLTDAQAKMQLAYRRIGAAPITASTIH